MNPFYQQNTPTTKEMWRNEPNKFRQWIIALGVALVIFALLTIIGIILVFNEKSALEKSYVDWFSKENVPNPLQSAKLQMQASFIIMPIITAVLTIISIVLYGMTIHKSYKMKSFSKISAFSIYFPEFLGIFTLFQVIYVSTKISIIGGHVGGIMIVVSQFFSIALLIFAWQVSKIRKTFIRSEQFEALQNSPEFQQMQQQMRAFFNAAHNGQNPSSAYGPAATNQNQEQNAANPIKETTPESPEVAELKKLEIEELRKIADKLSISGASKMDKDELVKTIIRVTNGG